MRHSRLVAVLVTSALAFAACGGDDSDSTGGSTGGSTDGPIGDSAVTLPPADSEEQPSDGSLDGAWVLTSGSLDGEHFEPIPGWDATLTIDGDRVTGTAACNGYGGAVSVGDEFELGGSFAVGELSWTEMGCEPAVMELEQTFLTVLQAVDSYELAQNLALAATGTGTSLLFERLAPVPTSDLVGNTWVLDTVIQGEAATNSPLMSSATLTLHDDGTLSGSTSCRELAGEWVESGAEIVFTSFEVIEDPTAGQCAPESVALENTIVSVLEGGFAPTIDGNRLTVMAAGGEGLSYVADDSATG